MRIFLLYPLNIHRYNTPRSTSRTPSLWTRCIISTERNQDGLCLGQKMYKMSLELLVITNSKAVTRTTGHM